MKNQYLILIVLVLLLPISPWIWKAIFSNEDTQCVIMLQNHIKAIIFVWILVAFIFGFKGGEIISIMSSIY